MQTRVTARQACCPRVTTQAMSSSSDSSVMHRRRGRLASMRDSKHPPSQLSQYGPPPSCSSAAPRRRWRAAQLRDGCGSSVRKRWRRMEAIWRGCRPPSATRSRTACLSVRAERPHAARSSVSASCRRRSVSSGLNWRPVCWEMCSSSRHGCGGARPPVRRTLTLSSAVYRCSSCVIMMLPPPAASAHTGSGSLGGGSPSPSASAAAGGPRCSCCAAAAVHCAELRCQPNDCSTRASSPPTSACTTTFWMKLWMSGCRGPPDGAFKLPSRSTKRVTLRRLAKAASCAAAWLLLFLGLFTAGIGPSQLAANQRWSSDAGDVRTAAAGGVDGARGGDSSPAAAKALPSESPLKSSVRRTERRAAAVGRAEGGRRKRRFARGAAGACMAATRSCRCCCSSSSSAAVHMKLQGIVVRGEAAAASSGGVRVPMPASSSAPSLPPSEASSGKMASSSSCWQRMLSAGSSVDPSLCALLLHTSLPSCACVSPQQSMRSRRSTVSALMASNAGELPAGPSGTLSSAQSWPGMDPSREAQS
mmetsp:Transcript_24265/g.62215  ORF Transcript_24265/g.62215 Transcript_24265/m.62215 type:complete len:532 (-) Transcript_24265:672-2267(-)